MPLQFNNQTLEIDGVQSIVVSTVQPDPNSNSYVRTIQIFDQPTNTTPIPTPVLTIQLYGGSQSIGDRSELAVNIPQITTD